MPAEATLDRFYAALVDPERPAPAETRGASDRPDERRFAVYRNNVAVGLMSNVEARYPVTRRLVGDGFFRGMAGAYVAGHKPRTPMLIDYAHDFPDFVAAFEPAREIAYLPDVARLENAWVEAYHAAEAEPLTLAALAAVEPERLGDLRFAPHPSARLLSFAHPAATIWAAHQGAEDPQPPEVWAPEDALVVRPAADVSVRVLPPGGHAFAAALFSGASLAEVAAPLEALGVDPALHLVGLVEAGALIATA